MLMEVFDRIREEHRRILATMDDLIGSEPEKRKDEINSLAMQIIAHMDAEERTIYKAFIDADDILRPLALRHQEEHRIARHLVAELRDEGLDDEHWAARLQVLHAIIQLHVRSEEREVFDIATDYFDQKEVDAMSEKFEKVETELYSGRMFTPDTPKL